MARGGRRYPLIIYREMINRWWPATLFLAFVLLVVAWLVYRDPLGQAEPWRWQWMAGVSGVAFAFTLMLFALRGAAYIQCLPTHIALVTPFLRMNISYKRLRRYTTAEVRTLFPPAAMRGWKYDLIAPLGGRTAVVLELSGWPIHPSFLRIFLSPLFFKVKDKTPHLVILVQDWMRFNTELESMRTSGETIAPPPRTADGRRRPASGARRRKGGRGPDRRQVRRVLPRAGGRRTRARLLSAGPPGRGERAGPGASRLARFPRSRV